MPSCETDFLIYWDRLDTGSRAKLLKAHMPDEGEQRQFQRFISNPIARATLEFACNRTIAYEDYLQLVELNRMEFAGEFRSHTRLAYGRTFPTIREKPLQSPVESSTSLQEHTSWYAPYVEAYICRNVAKGIVVERELLEAAIDICDTEFLSLVVDPRTGERLFERPHNPKSSIRSAPALKSMNPPAIHRRRRGMLSWLSIDERGVLVHDLMKPLDLKQLRDRGLPADDKIREIV